MFECYLRSADAIVQHLMYFHFHFSPVKDGYTHVVFTNHSQRAAHTNPINIITDMISDLKK